MATQETPMIDWDMLPETTGDVTIGRIANELTLANAPGNELCVILPAAATISADAGFHGSFIVPPDYMGSPVARVSAILDGAPGALVIALGIRLSPRADDEPYDVALGTENIESASSVPHVSGDIYVQDIPIADTLAAGDTVNYFCFINNNVHTFTGQLLVRKLPLRYSDV